MTTTVLITGAGGPAGKSLIAQLRARADIRIVATDIRELADSGADDFLVGPRADSPELIPFLLDTIKSHGIDLFIPTVQDELPAVATAASILPTRVLLSPAGAVGICHDKWLTARALAQADIPVPHTTVGTTDTHEYPLVVKPRVARGGRGVSVIDSPGALGDLDASVLVQSFAPGTEYCPQLFLADDGSVSCVVLEKTSLRDGRVGNADAVVRVDSAAVPDVADTAIAAARELGLRGPLDMDIRRDGAGVPVVLEINARFGANSAYAPELLDLVLEQ